MHIGHDSNLETVQIKGQSKNVAGKVIFSPESGWDGHVMRKFTVQKDGYTFNHYHDFYHVIYVVGGTGTVMMNDEVSSITAGSYAFIPANVPHQLVNTNDGEEPLEFLCIVPAENHTFG